MLNKILLGLNKNLTKIIKTFIFFWLLLCVYRLIFIWGMSEYLSADSGHNLILTAIYSGAKLSLQTAGGLTLCMLIGFFRAKHRPNTVFAFGLLGYRAASQPS